VKNTNGQNSGTSGQLKDRPGKRWTISYEGIVLAYNFN
jgi:hypothetical protein